MAIEDGDGSGGDQRLHGGCLLGVGTDGQKALPVGVFGGRTGAIVVQAGGGDLGGFDDGGGWDVGVVHGYGGGDYRHGFGGIADWRGCGGEVQGKDLIDGEVL